MKAVFRPIEFPKCVPSSTLQFTKVVATGLRPVYLCVAVHIRETAHRAVATTASLGLLSGQSPE